MIALSPLAKQGYSNIIAYTHSSTLRTFEEFFGVTPLLGDAANATDLSDFSHLVTSLPTQRSLGPLDPSPAPPLPPPPVRGRRRQT
jgi:hypothetical protein